MAKLAEFVLNRVDHRLIHGQVMAMWMRTLKSNRILVVDDPLAKEPFMQRVYIAAAPPNTKVVMMTIDQAIQRWKQDRFGDGYAVCLVRDVETAVSLWKQGFPIKELQIGNLAIIPNEKLLHQKSRFTKQHYDKIVEMIEGGVYVYCQSTPLDNKVDVRDFVK
jgi:D-glucosaminate-specific PTS system IIB component